jgi:hypothetical protein
MGRGGGGLEAVVALAAGAAAALDRARRPRGVRGQRNGDAGPMTRQTMERQDSTREEKEVADGMIVGR